MIFKNSKLFLVILLLTSVLLVAILIFEIYNIQFQNRETSELINLADQDTKIGVLAQSIRIQQNNVVEDIRVFDGLLLSNDKLVSLIETIEEAGRTFDLDTDIVSVEKIEDKKATEPDIIRITIETRGAWAPTFSFARAIESLPHRVMINGLDLSKDEDDWRLKIILSLYLFN